MQLFQLRWNLGLISSTAQSSELCAVFESTGVLRERGNFSAIHDRWGSAKTRWKSGWEETTSFLLGSSRSRWNCIFLPPAFLFSWASVEEPSKCWTNVNKDVVEGKSKYTKILIHPLMVCGPVERALDLQNRSGAFLLLFILFLLRTTLAVSQSDCPRPLKQTDVTGTVSGHQHLCMISLGPASGERGKGQPASAWTMADLCARVWPPKHICVCTWYLFLRDGWAGRAARDGSGREAHTSGRTSDTLVCSS